MAEQAVPHEPIAVIGLSCRFAGNTTSPSSLWELLKDPKDLSEKVPEARFNYDAFHHEDGEYHGTSNALRGYWLDQPVGEFDAAFFNISRHEAESMDPQQRILLETSYETIESSKYTLDNLRGSDTAVYVGAMTADFDQLSGRDELTTSQYYATGNARSIISNRLSYCFDLRGPSMTIDTACSSSLVALHQATLSLRAKECSLALVAGVNLMLTPEQFIVESSLHMLSPNGKGRMWDQEADGYARGEGVAALLLKPLSAAIRDGDNIKAIVRSTGSNSDGRTPGLTMPSVESQAALIKSTYGTAGLNLLRDEDRPQFFEAHGTGTQAGDPREANAIQQAFFPDDSKPSDTKLMVGSVKTVIGHTEGAAGLAGVLKVVQAMKNGTVPPNLHLDKLNDKVAPFCRHLVVPTTCAKWPTPSPGQPLRASVNSFGFGGSNAHAIVEIYDQAIHDNLVRHSPLEKTSPGTLLRKCQLSSPPKLPFVISAASEVSLREAAVGLRDILQHSTKFSIEAVSNTLLTQCTAHAHRMVLPPGNREQLIAGISDALQMDKTTPLGARTRRLPGPPKILGIFTGQGAQWKTMGRGLLQSNSTFANTIHELDTILRQCQDPPTWSLEGQMLAKGAGSRVDEPAISQPLCTAIQIALVDVLERLNLRFGAVVGHSSGEIGAAYAAGYLSKRDAILVAYFRGLHAHLARGPNGEEGAMIAVGLSASEAQALCHEPKYRGKLSIAAVNSSNSFTLSGDHSAVVQAMDSVTASGKFARLLKTNSTAYHSPIHMLEPARAYTESLKHCGISPRSTGNGTAWISSVRDGPVSSDELKNSYWCDNMVQPVQFHHALETALEDHGPFDIAIEVGPHPALASPASQTMREVLGNPLPYAGILKRQEDDGIAFANFIGFLWRHTGHAFDFVKFLQDSSMPELSQVQVELPAYPWDHSQTYWREPRIARQYHNREDPPHELLGVRTRDDTDLQRRWRNVLHLKRLPWLSGHSFQKEALLPASAYCIMAMDAARTLVKEQQISLIELEDLEFPSGIAIDDDHMGTELLFTLNVVSPTQGPIVEGSISGEFTLSSGKADSTSQMHRNFSGRVTVHFGPQAASVDLPPRPKLHAETFPVDKEAFYQMMIGIGLDYTGPFKALHGMRRRFHSATAQLKPFHEEDTTKLKISPATLDACFQLCFATWSSPGDRALWTTFLPIRIDRVRFDVPLCDEAKTVDLTVDANLTDFTPNSTTANANITGDISIYNSREEMEIQVQGLTVGSFAPAPEEADREAYLHTLLHLDPEDRIIPFAAPAPAPASASSTAETVTSATTGSGLRTFAAAFRAADNYPLLKEQCERVIGSIAPSLVPLPRNIGALETLAGITKTVAKTKGHTSREPWLLPDDAALASFMAGSRFNTTLQAVRALAARNPDVLLTMLAGMLKEAGQMAQLQDRLLCIVDQIAHKYPRMNVLALTDKRMSLTEHVLAGLNNSFVSYTCGTELESNIEQRLQGPKVMRKVSSIALDLAGDFETNLPAGTPKYDLVIISTTKIPSSNSASVLRQLRSMMKQGGFLIAVDEISESLESRIGRFAEEETADTLRRTPSHWSDRLSHSGFMEPSQNCFQSFPPRLSIIVRQTPCEGKRMLRQISLPHLPFATNSLSKLLIVGGTQHSTALIVQDVRATFEAFCKETQHVLSLDDVDIETAGSVDSVILLSDLDGGVISSITDQTLDIMRGMFRSETTMLWVTHKATEDNPENAASFGFARTIIAETPGLVLQMINLDTLDDAARHISEAFARLMVNKSADMTDVLYVHEPEVHIEDGLRMVPRVVPFDPPNKRYNAVRRTVTETFDSLETAVKVVRDPAVDGAQSFSLAETSYPRATSMHSSGSGTREVRVQVQYSSLLSVKMRNQSRDWFICYGVDLDAEKLSHVLCLADESASVVEARSDMTVKVVPLEQPDQVCGHIAAAFFIKAIVSEEKNKTLILVNASESMISLAQREAERGNATFRFWTTDASKKGTRGMMYLHPMTAGRDLKSKLPDGVFTVFDFSAGTIGAFSRLLKDILPANCRYNPDPTTPWDVTHSVEVGRSDREVATLFKDSHMVTMLLFDDDAQRKDFPVISVRDALRKPEKPFDQFSIVDWRQERVFEAPISPVQDVSHVFDKRGIYVLVGLTKDFGQSICRLFISKGAKNLVVASRNPPKNPQWRTELESSHDGLNIVIESVDAIDLTSVENLKKRIKEHFSPGCRVRGIVNGAMVLDDRVFAQMDAATMHRVLRPKTVGSANLDRVFDDGGVRFFIMTSSFAAIGGHAGQSNYAAANMFMNGLAAARRGRGRAASVLNIGVIYGLGFLQRERDELYAGLERDGYPPISEHDLHHMFLEAIKYGHPDEYQIDGLTTGLSRYRIDDPNPIAWHRDPRFSHFTVDDDQAGVHKEGSEEVKSIKEMLAETKTEDEAIEVLIPALAKQLGMLVRAPTGSVTGESSVGDLGVDSLVAVEFRTWIYQNVGVSVPVMKILNSTSLAGLCRDVAKECIKNKEKAEN